MAGSFVMWALVSQASASELTLQGVVIGDVDGSGAKDQIEVSTTEAGEVVLEIALDVPEELFGKEMSLDKSDVTLELLESKESGRLDPVLTLDGERYAFAIDDETLKGAGGGGNDDLPDVSAVFRKAKDGLSLSWGLGGFGFGDYCTVCVEWALVAYPCASTPDGVEYCYAWVCVRTGSRCTPA